MTECLQERWTYRTEKAIRCIVLSQDGRIVLAGCEKGLLYCFARSGELLWQRNTGSNICSLALAEGCERIIAGCANGDVCVWNYSGQLLCTFTCAGSVQHIAVTPTAHRIACGSEAGELSLFDVSGTRLWQQKGSEKPVTHLALTANGKTMIAGMGVDSILLLHDSGGGFLSNSVEGRFQTYSQTLPLLIAGFKASILTLFDAFGHSLWHFKSRDPITASAITFDGRFVLVGTRKEILLLNEEEKILWQYTTTDAPEQLMIAHDGSFVIVRTRTSTLVLNAAGVVCSTHYVHPKQCTMVMTPNARLLLIGQENAVSLYENSEASDNMSDAWLESVILPQIRQAYALSSWMGTAAWFDAFDNALMHREFALCESLLREIRTFDYHLSPAENSAVTSRQGSLLLYQGLRFHQHKDAERARTAYEQSCAIQHTLPYPPGEGQALSALHLLQDGLDETSPAFLELLVNPPELSGNSETLLIHHLPSLSLFEQMYVVLVARRKGYILPLMAALASKHIPVQAAAATALAWLQPGPGIADIVRMLKSSSWMTRWQASLILMQKTKLPAFVMLPDAQQALHAIIACLKNEADPLVRRSFILLLGHIGNASQEAGVLPALDDPDPDVRSAAVETLGLIGTRRVIPALQQVKDDTDFAGKRVQAYVSSAIDSIKKRHPLVIVQEMVCCSELTAKQQPVHTATLFLTTTPIIHCAVTLENPAHSSRITCVATLQSSTLQKNIQLHPIWSIEPTAFSNTMIFSFTAPNKNRTWQAGDYTIEVLYNDNVQQKMTITLMQHVLITNAVICSNVSPDGHAVNAQKEFMKGISRVYCSVAFATAPIGLEIKGSVYRIDAKTRTLSTLFARKTYQQTETFVAEGKATTTQEGKQWIALSWQAHQWKVGAYVVKLKSTTDSTLDCNFHIVAPPGTG